MSCFTENQGFSTLGIFYVGQQGNCIPVSPYLYTIWLTLQWSLCLSRTLHFPWMLGKAFTINEAQRWRQRQLNQYLFLWSSQKILLYSVSLPPGEKKQIHQMMENFEHRRKEMFWQPVILEQLQMWKLCMSDQRA